MLILFNKPYQVLSQFRSEGGKRSLAEFIDIPDVYPAGRLDWDSEGLMLLTDEGSLQQRISHPRHKLPKVYWAQVEGRPPAQALATLRRGVVIQERRTHPAKVKTLAEPKLWPRTPPIRYRQHIPTSWLQLTLHEGRNRQVRHMTAAVGHPTLRLIRYAIGPCTVEGLAPGQWRAASTAESAQLMGAQ